MLFWQQGQLGVVDTAVLAAASGSPTVVVVQGDEGTGKTFVPRRAGRPGHRVRRTRRGRLRSARRAFLRHPRAVGRDRRDGIHTAGLPLRWQPSSSTSCSTGMRTAGRCCCASTTCSGPTTNRSRRSPGCCNGRPGTGSWSRWPASPMASTIHPAWQRWSSGRGRVMPIELAGLPLEDASRLVHDVRPDLNAATVQRLWSTRRATRRTSPRLLAEHDAADLVSRQWLPAPRAFADAIESRSRRLSEDALALARAIAVLGTERCSLADAGRCPRSPTRRTPPRSWRARAWSRSAPQARDRSSGSPGRSCARPSTR